MTDIDIDALQDFLNQAHENWHDCTWIDATPLMELQKAIDALDSYQQPLEGELAEIEAHVNDSAYTPTSAGQVWRNFCRTLLTRIKQVTAERNEFRTANDILNRNNSMLRAELDAAREQLASAPHMPDCEFFEYEATPFTPHTWRGAEPVCTCWKGETE